MRERTGSILVGCGVSQEPRTTTETRRVLCPGRRARADPRSSSPPLGRRGRTDVRRGRGDHRRALRRRCRSPAVCRRGGRRPVTKEHGPVGILPTGPLSPGASTPAPGRGSALGRAGYAGAKPAERRTTWESRCGRWQGSSDRPCGDQVGVASGTLPAVIFAGDVCNAPCVFLVRVSTMRPN
jgi:hypothetical protein